MHACVAIDDTTLFEPTLPTIRTITPDAINRPSPVHEVSSPGSSLKRRSALRVPHASRSDVISPSVYSRATDGASLRPLSPEGEEGTTTILITGREVRRYSISPAKPQQPRHRGHGSGSWRKWLSDEMKTSLGTGEPHYQSLSVPSNEEYMQARRTPSPAMQSLMRGPSPVTQTPPGHQRSQEGGSWRTWLSDEMKTTLGTDEQQQFRLLNSASNRPGSISPLSEPGEDAGQPRSRTSSIVSAMNDRYPRIVPSRTSLSKNFGPPSMRALSPSSYRETSRPLSPQSYQEPARPPTNLGTRENVGRTSMSRPLNSYGSKENVRPPSSTGRPPPSPLPSLSSSQWLAAGSHRPRPGVRKMSLKEAVAQPSLTRLSARESRQSMREPKAGVSKPSSSLSRQSMMEMRDRSRRSPGQHMVTDWLNERKSRESLVKRAELEDTSIGGGAFL